MVPEPDRDLLCRDLVAVCLREAGQLKGPLDHGGEVLGPNVVDTRDATLHTGRGGWLVGWVGGWPQVCQVAVCVGGRGGGLLQPLHT